MAAVFVRTVQWGLEDFKKNPLTLHPYLFMHDDPQVVVKALPLQLVDEPDNVVDCIDAFLKRLANEFFNAFDLKTRVEIARMQRGG